MAEVGRPSVFDDPETLKKLEEAFLLGCSDKEACLVANISPATLYNYQNAHPEFIERKEVLKENQIYLARQSVARHMADDGDLAIKFLERKKKDEFSLRQEMTGRDGKDLPTPILGYVSSNNSNTEDNVHEQKDQGNTGGDIGQQDSLDSALPDKPGAI